MQTIRAFPEPSFATPSRGVLRVRHELKVRMLEVLRAERISPHFVDVVLGGAELEGFVSASFDDHVKLMLPAAGEVTLSPPTLGPSGPQWASGGRPTMRDYTPRRMDWAARELHIEMALHGHGPAAEWAQAAAPGQRVGVGGPKGSMIIAEDFDWHLLIGDDSALPAIARRLEELPDTSEAIVVMQLSDAADRRVFESRANPSIHWVPPGEVALMTTLRDLALPLGEGFAWAAGESKCVRALRQLLVDVHGFDKQHIRAAAYWKNGAAAHHENLVD